ncbi:response regulator transcription factor [Nocardioides terrisoli]|uniref:response regulator transcription factor n=1 Tax=Nocardioides terrisoli TaxID=3388267 RepID=UPI00287BA1F9|nr:response regulator transcription factor [Nocardioides marmorisolisilvae]
MHVVVVDDEKRLVALIRNYFDDFEVTSTGCHDGSTGLAAARAPGVDVVVLDRMLPGLTGVEVCRQLRTEGNDVPVLMLTARGAVDERVEGLEAGADDYLVKPFALEELLARVRALGRRRPVSDDQRWTVGDVVFDPLGHQLWVAGEKVALSRREFAMLGSLVEHFGRVVTRQRLFEDVWPEGIDIRSNALDVHMSRVRKALSNSAEVQVVTLRGIGYRLDREPG